MAPDDASVRWFVVSGHAQGWGVWVLKGRVSGLRAWGVKIQGSWV